MTAAAIRQLARDLIALREQVRALSTQPQLSYSSIEGGAINGYSDDGTHTSSTGTQFDGSSGSYALNGPTPPTPSAPTLTSIDNGLVVHWDGTFADNAIITMDFSRVEVHVSLTPNFDPSTSATLRGSIESPRGGEIVVLGPPVQHYVKFVARSLPGKSSAPSAETSGRPYALSFRVDRWADPTPPATLELAWVPIPGSVNLFVNGVAADEGVDYTASAVGDVLTPAAGLLAAGDVVWARYAYRQGGPPNTAVPATSQQSGVGTLYNNTGYEVTTSDVATGMLYGNTAFEVVTSDVATGMLYENTT